MQNRSDVGSETYRALGSYDHYDRDTFLTIGRGSAILFCTKVYDHFFEHFFIL